MHTLALILTATGGYGSMINMANNSGPTHSIEAPAP